MQAFSTTALAKTEVIHQAAVLNVLLVEDSPFQQHVVSFLLQQLGHSVSIASDGFDALSAVQREHHDVILMDCQMSLMDGFEATRLIKEILRSTNKHIPIIGVSANLTAEECFAAGMDDFLRKPVKKQILKAILSRWSRQNH